MDGASRRRAVPATLAGMTDDVDWTRLTRHLRRFRRGRVEVSLEEIERIVTGPLPPAAAGSRYWANTTGRADAWRSAGYRATRRGAAAGHIAFVREAEHPPALTVVREPVLTGHAEANHLVVSDPFALLLGVLFDHGIPAERAWRAPFDLQQRLGHLDPGRVAADADAVRAAVAQPPVLHRYAEAMAGWVVAAARTVVDGYGGDAGQLWSDRPTRAQLRRRLLALDGVGPTKADRAVALLEHVLGVPLADDSAGEVA